MNRSPLAGKPAPLSLLVDVPQLVTAYYTGVPDAAIPAQRVAFGTSGHRGSSLDLTFNESHVLAITEAICLYRVHCGIDGPLFLGIDTHALSVPACATALEVLAARGVDVMIAEGDDPAWDAIEANALYERLEQEVIPEVYDRNAAGLPVAWVARIRESMARLTPRFSATRAVREYTDERYLPAAAAYRAHSAHEGAKAKSEVAWQTEWHTQRDGIHFNGVTEEHGDQERTISASIFLGDVVPDMVRVELYANAVNGGAAVTQEMTRGRTKQKDRESYLYSTTVPSARPASDYTARIIPQRDDLNVPLEARWILWQK